MEIMKRLGNKLVFYTIIKRLELTVNHIIVVTKGPLKYNESMTSNEILPLRENIYYSLDSHCVTNYLIQELQGGKLSQHV